uniref:8 kDa Amblyomma family member n=1 Tax=Rhipicephalus appendiculatus TaxID=34631 RepID=A0A131YV93_RHIAP
MSVKVLTFSLLAVIVMLIYKSDVSSAFPHKWSYPAYCPRTKSCTPQTVYNDCGPGCQCTYYRPPGPEFKKGRALMTCSGA